MDLSRFFSRDAQGLLELIAVIVHSGSLDKGHYYCFARRSDQVLFTIIAVVRIQR